MAQNSSPPLRTHLEQNRPTARCSSFNPSVQIPDQNSLHEHLSGNLPSSDSPPNPDSPSLYPTIQALAKQLRVPKDSDYHQCPHRFRDREHFTRFQEKIHRVNQMIFLKTFHIYSQSFCVEEYVLQKDRNTSAGITKEQLGQSSRNETLSNSNPQGQRLPSTKTPQEEEESDGFDVFSIESNDAGLG